MDPLLLTPLPTREGFFKEKIRYPKLVLLGLTFLVAYMLFSRWESLPFYNFISAHSYMGAFFAGLFFVYGFTAAPATVLLLYLSQQGNIWLIIVLAGAGALVGDLIVFRIIQHSMADEIERIWHWKFIWRLSQFFHRAPDKWRKYLLMVFAGFIIASPLPDEIGVSLLASASDISLKRFIVVSYVLNTVGIFVILMIGANVCFFASQKC